MIDQSVVFIYLRNLSPGFETLLIVPVFLAGTSFIVFFASSIFYSCLFYAEEGWVFVCFLFIYLCLTRLLVSSYQWYLCWYCLFRLFRFKIFFSKWWVTIALKLSFDSYILLLDPITYLFLSLQQSRFQTMSESIITKNILQYLTLYNCFLLWTLLQFSIILLIKHCFFDSSFFFNLYCLNSLTTLYLMRWETELMSWSRASTILELRWVKKALRLLRIQPRVEKNPSPLGIVD